MVVLGFRIHRKDLPNRLIIEKYQLNFNRFRYGYELENENLNFTTLQQ